MAGTALDLTGSIGVGVMVMGVMGEAMWTGWIGIRGPSSKQSADMAATMEVGMGVKLTITVILTILRITGVIATGDMGVAMDEAETFTTQIMSSCTSVQDMVALVVTAEAVATPVIHS